jgi:hypothetical protein
MLEFTVELIKDETRLARLTDRISSVGEFSLDIETVNWWNRHQEQVSIIQLAYRTEGKAKVAIIDALSKPNLNLLRIPLELDSVTKVIHNAAFDASRLAKHFKFNVAPIYDTMVAARRHGERRYSLKAQVETHLKIHLDKDAQRSDWSRRPLDPKQIQYAALDACSTLLLFENQIKRNLNGAFQLKDSIASPQALLPLSDSPETLISPTIQDVDVKSKAGEKDSKAETGLSLSSQALLGIVAELPTRFHPDKLSVSVGSERIGLAGWIIDRFLGKDSDLDEETAKIVITDLCDQNLIRITPTRRLEATDKGSRLWQQLKSM